MRLCNPVAKAKKKRPVIGAPHFTTGKIKDQAFGIFSFQPGWMRSGFLITSLLAS